MKRFVVFLFLFLLILSVKTTLAFEYTIEPSLSLSEEYNDNIFLDHTDRVDDFITYISPAIDLSVRSSTSELKIGYSPTFSFYKSNNDLNETAHRFSLNGNFTLSNRLKFTIMDTFIKSSEISDIRDIPNVGPVRRRAGLQYHAPNVSMSYRLTENLSYILGVSYFDYDYKETGFNEVKTYSGNMGLNYNLSKITTLSVNARYARYDFRPTSDATQQDYLLGVKHRFTPTLTVGITGGTTITKIQDTGESSTDLSVGIDLTKIFEKKGEGALSCRQTVVTDIDTGEPVRERRAKFSLLKPITEKWTVSLSASYGNYKSIVTNNKNTDEAQFKAGLTYNFTPLAKLRPMLTLSYSYFDSNDKINDRNDYYNNIILFTLKLGYSTEETPKY